MPSQLSLVTFAQKNFTGVEGSNYVPFKHKISCSFSKALRALKQAMKLSPCLLLPYMITAHHRTVMYHNTDTKCDRRKLVPLPGESVTHKRYHKANTVTTVLFRHKDQGRTNASFYSEHNARKHYRQHSKTR